MLPDDALVFPATFETLFDLSSDAILVTDAQGNVRGANERAEAMFGYGRGELIDQPIENLVPERYRGRHPAHRKTYNTNPHSLHGR